MRSAPVRAVAPPGGGLDVRVAASTGCELLIELSVLAAEDRDTLDPARRRWAEAAAAGMPAGLRRAVGRVGDRSGEVWLHLLGFALEGPAPRGAPGRAGQGAGRRPARADPGRAARRRPRPRRGRRRAGPRPIDGPSPSGAAARRRAGWPAGQRSPLPLRPSRRGAARTARPAGRVPGRRLREEEPVLYRLLGRSGLRVSELALGTMTFGEDWGWGASPAECGRMLDRYGEAGGNFIDTAGNYTDGSSERIVGEVVAADRDRWVIATKYTLTSRRDDPNAGGNHRKSLVRSLEASLRRLGTDRVDLLWLHMWDQTTPVAEAMRALDDQVRAGKVL